MANFAPLVGEALPAYGLPRPAFPYEEGDANKSTPGMKWLPINYARPAKCNDFLTLRGASECYPRLRPMLEGCRRVLELANGETVGVGSAVRGCALFQRLSLETIERTALREAK